MAIAFDAATAAPDSNAASSASWSHTCTGSNLVLVVGIAAVDGNAQANRTVSSITYNGVSLTQIRSDDNGTTARSELWYLLNPATGSNTVSVTMGGTCAGFNGGSISLTGVKQSGQPDANTGTTGSSATSISMTLTTVADNSWIVDILRPSVAASSETANGSQVSKVVVQGTNVDGAMSILGPITPATGTSIGWSWTTSAASICYSAASFAPASTPPYNQFNNYAFVKVGDGMSTSEKIR